MKLPALIFLGFLFLLPAQAQKCRFISNTVSGMDGTHLVITEPKMYVTKSDMGKVEVWAKLHVDTVMVLSFVLNGSDGIAVNRGDSLVFFHEEKEIIQLTIMQDAARQPDVARSLTLFTLINKDDYLSFADTRISSVHIQTVNGWIKLDSDTRAGAKSISKVLGCVYQNIAD